MIAALRMLVKEFDKRGKAAGSEKCLRPARRILNDVSLLFSTWGDTLRIDARDTNVKMLVQRDIQAFDPYLTAMKPELSISYAEGGADLAGIDQELVSMCFRSLLAQAIQQSEKGVIHVAVHVDEQVLKRRTEIVLTVTDCSQRPSGAPPRYVIHPESYERNPFLKGRVASVLRLNLARSIAIKMGGGLRIDYLKSGACRFTFRFQGDKVALADDEDEEAEADAEAALEAAAA